MTCESVQLNQIKKKYQMQTGTLSFISVLHYIHSLSSHADTHDYLKVGITSPDTLLHKLWTHHKVGVRLNPARPHPGILLSDGAQPHAVFSVEGGLFIRAPHDYVLALGEVADATRVISESPVFSDLRETKREVDITQRTKVVFLIFIAQGARANTSHCLGLTHIKVHGTFSYPFECLMKR